MSSSSDRPSLTCALIGADSLLLECGEALLTKGHRIEVVAAGSPRVARWARAKSIPVVDASGPAATWQPELAGYTYDWLFAITHLAMLPADVLSIPQAGAVNFHDGPLPRYAGLNAPAWALINGETTYGITWHVIGAGVDDGDILAQELFEVAPSETSLSLNTRNFEAALESFERLVDEIADGRQVATPQAADEQRRVYRRVDRPASMAVLDWERPAEELDRLVRALDFGQYPNPLAAAKLVTDDDAVVIDRAEAVAGPAGAPGDVLAADDEQLTVACAEGALAITAARTLSGEHLTPSQLAERLGVRAGSRLPVMTDDERDARTRLGDRLASAERHHLAQLTDLEAIDVPWAATPTPDHLPRFSSLRVDAPASDPSIIPVAFTVLLARLAGKERFHVSLVDPATTAEFAPVGGLVASSAPFEARVSLDDTAGAAVERLSASLDAARRRAPFARDLIARTPDLAAIADLRAGRALPIGISFGADAPPAGIVLDLTARDDGSWAVRFDDGLVARADAEVFTRSLSAVAAELVGDPTDVVGDLDLLGEELRHELIVERNATWTSYQQECVHELFAAQAAATPDRAAVAFGDRSVTYRALHEQAGIVARRLRALGVGPDEIVGVHVGRGIELVVAVLGVLGAGGAYLPLDPAYPDDRVAHMISDSGCRIIVSHSSTAPRLPADVDPSVHVLLVDQLSAVDPGDGDTGGGSAAEETRPDHLAYCIYTSGSTGLPKGVLIEHRNVVNFFTAMDEVVPHDDAATWLAVTSLSFDISVLELLYTLTRGMTVVVYKDPDRVDEAQETFVERHGHRSIDFSLFYFSGDESAAEAGPDKYRLLLDGARWADAHGFCAVWTPERHFHAFGGLYPQPAVTSAAIAVATERIQIRAGSVVMPLSHPIRVAEAWSVVDNLSNGRVAISMASGWQPNDFVLMPENYADAKQAMFDGLDAVKRLWHGETLTFDGPRGPVEVQTLPRPVQPELPIWITTAGNPDTYVQAGRIGANVLTHLLGQSVEQLEPKIAAYRKARADAGFDPDDGIVSLMLHTFVGDDAEAVREVVREPLKQYLGTSFSLLKEYAWAFPAFQRPGNETAADHGLADDDFRDLSAEELDAVLEFAFLRYYESSGLFGTPEGCVEMVDRLKGIGVNEIACLIDFGVDADAVLGSLDQLDELRVRANRPAEEAPATLDMSFAAQVDRHGVSHLQCTPSMARMLSTQDEERAALGRIDNLFIGGEAFPVALAKDLRHLSRTGRITNMYGPTETTIWSTTWPLHGDLDVIPIGRPIANTSIYILDDRRQPLPPGVPGNLWIGGDGVVRGYHRRPELTAERFAPDPFREGHRMYLTGDLAKWVTDASGTAIIEFLGRADHQVKIRGHRIELGEIEARLGACAGVLECVVVVREDTPGDQQLVGYLSAQHDVVVDPAAVKEQLRAHLPDVMVPGHIVVMEDLPHTPNGKIDRNGLPSLTEVLGRRARAAAPVLAGNETERQVLAVWEETLATTGIGVDDNFFDIGGHSLLVVRMHRRLREHLERPIALTDLYRFPTVRTFAASLSAADGPSQTVTAGADRAARRLQRRRSR